MGTLKLAPNFTDTDAFFAALTSLHLEKTTEESAHINAKLILLLSNHIGDNRILEQAMQIAGKTE